MTEPNETSGAVTSRDPWPERLTSLLLCIVGVFTVWWTPLYGGEIGAAYIAGFCLYLLVVKAMLLRRGVSERRPWVKTRVLAGWVAVTLVAAAVVRMAF
ncbi:hypothetical protein WI697_07915 [Tistrella mobilis]|uniref:hypothetical protein n=1 Tax=Tistrella mobilis TaxID=171437 RepID=UPI0031F5F1C3